jgi:hypothetical protein
VGARVNGIKLGVIAAGWLACAATLLPVAPAFAGGTVHHQPGRGSRAGTLDRSFGAGGKTMVVAPKGNVAHGEFGMVEGSREEIFLYRANTIVELSSNGRVDRGFGRAGRITVQGTEGTTFALEAVAVDSSAESS